MPQISIDGYELKRKIGAGGMSTVWLARQRSLDRFVAIKMLDERLAAGADDVARFEAEARIAASLKHISIVQVLDAGVSDRVCYIVMEHVDGYTVGDWLRRKKRLAEADALDVAECVADALGYAWRRSQLVHCDIKPDNVMVDADGTVKVTDLGLARTLQQMQDHLPQNEIMGTPAYISPEQAMGHKTLDLRADIYSLGATLYHLVGGRMLFHSLSEDEAMDQQVNGTDVDVCEHNPDVSTPLCFLLEKMLCKDPAARHSSWQAVAKDLRRVRDGLMPYGSSPRVGISTMRRSKKRSHAATPRQAVRVHRGELAEHVSHRELSAHIARRRQITAAGSAAVALVLAVAAFSALQLWHGGRNNDTAAPVAHSSDQVYADVAAILCGGNSEGACEKLEQQGELHDSLMASDEHDAVIALLRKVCAIEQQIEIAFSREIGTPVTLFMTGGGALNGRIDAVESHSLRIQTAEGGALLVNISELALRERLRRMPQAAPEAVALYKAVEAIRCHNKEYARDYLVQVPQPLKGALARHAEL